MMLPTKGMNQVQHWFSSKYQKFRNDTVTVSPLYEMVGSKAGIGDFYWELAT